MGEETCLDYQGSSTRDDAIRSLEKLAVDRHTIMKMLWVADGLLPAMNYPFDSHSAEYASACERMDLAQHKGWLYRQGNRITEEMIRSLDNPSRESETPQDSLRSRWRALGTLYGYPECCVDYFVRSNEPSQKQGFFGVEYVACPSCSSNKNSASQRLKEDLYESLEGYPELHAEFSRLERSMR